MFGVNDEVIDDDKHKEDIMIFSKYFVIQYDMDDSSVSIPDLKARVVECECKFEITIFKKNPNTYIV